MHTEPIIEIRKLKKINIDGGVVFEVVVAVDNCIGDIPTIASIIIEQ